MSVTGYLLSGSKFKKAKKLTERARSASADSAGQLFKEAYDTFAEVSNSHSVYPESLHGWGFALLHQAESKTGDEAVKILDEAVSKFSLCQTLVPTHLGAALDGGVALLALAKAKGVNLDHEIYAKAKESFMKADEIQDGAAAYNLACMFALQSDGDACLEALEKARDTGLVPEEQAIRDDEDLDNVKQMPWFEGYIKSLSEQEDEEETAEIDYYKKTKIVEEPKKAVEKAAETKTEQDAD